MFRWRPQIQRKEINEIEQSSDTLEECRGAKLPRRLNRFHPNKSAIRRIQPRSRSHYREQRLAFLAFLVTFDWLTSGDIKIRLNNDAILPTIPRCTELGTSGKNVCIT